MVLRTNTTTGAFRPRSDRLLLYNDTVLRHTRYALGRVCVWWRFFDFTLLIHFFFFFSHSQTDTARWARKRRPRRGRRAWAAAGRTAAPARSAARTWRSTRRATRTPGPAAAAAPWPWSVRPTTTWRSARKRSSDVPRTTATGWRRSTGRTWRSPPNCSRRRRRRRSYRSGARDRRRPVASCIKIYISTCHIDYDGGEQTVGRSVGYRRDFVVIIFYRIFFFFYFVINRIV